MSEKRNYSNVLSAASDSSAEALISEPARKRRKSQRQESPISSDDNRPTLPTNGAFTASAMTEVQDAHLGVQVSTPTKNGTIANNSVAVNNQKQIRYDRQLRLWGDHGQELLESAHVCLLNVTAIGTEVLKSLILPGVGAFTIIDGALVSGADVGANFFLESSRIGEPRAKAACELLQELNPEVMGHHIVLSPEKAIAHHGLAIFDQFTVVVGTNLKRAVISEVGAYLFNRGIPFLICQSYGLIGYIRLLVREHQIIESHPDSPLANLMLDQPFPELLQLVDSIDLDSLNHKDHSHTPYLILLFKALEKWRQREDLKTAFPRVYADKKEIKAILLSMRKPDEKGLLDEENFEEAINSVNTSMTETVVPTAVKEIINDEAAVTLTSSSSNFWILCNALRRFVQEHGRLPVRGTLPDMLSDSERYLKLQNVFIRKAEEEAALVHSFAVEASTPLQRQMPISETRQFCKNAAFLRLIRNPLSLNEENDSGMTDGGFLSELENEENLNALWYLILTECDGFFGDHDRYPCSTMAADANDQSVTDKANLITRVEARVKKLVGGKEKVKKLDDAVGEVCRYGGSEIHGVASFLGGTAAQEVIKLITHQYVPLNNTFVFDGNTGNGSVFSL